MSDLNEEKSPGTDEQHEGEARFEASLAALLPQDLCDAQQQSGSPGVAAPWVLPLWGQGGQTHHIFTIFTSSVLILEEEKCVSGSSSSPDVKKGAAKRAVQPPSLPPQTHSSSKTSRGRLGDNSCLPGGEHGQGFQCPAAEQKVLTPLGSLPGRRGWGLALQPCLAQWLPKGKAAAQHMSHCLVKVRVQPAGQTGVAAFPQAKAAGR